MFSLKKSVYKVGLALSLFASTFAAEYKVDKTHSAMLFSIHHMGLGNTWGRFNDFSGTVKYDENNLSAAEINVEIKVASVDTDLSKRDNHIRNTDIFDAGTYPSMKFSGKGFEKIEGGKLKMSGKITIKGKSQDLTVIFKKVGQGKHFYTKKPAIGLETEFMINRRDFGVGQGKVDGGMGKDVRIIVALEALVK